MNNRGFVVLILTVILCLQFATAQTSPINWYPNKLNLEGFPGTSNLAKLSFISDKDLDGVSLWIVPELAHFIKVEPNYLDSIKSGIAYSVDLFISIPADALIGIYEGTLHIRNGASTLPETLKISLNVDTPTIETIPETVAIPSEDRITEDPDTGEEFVLDEIVFFCHPGTSVTAVKTLANSINGVFLGSIPGLDFYQIRVPARNILESRQLISQVVQDVNISYACRHFLYQPYKVPNDPACGEWNTAYPEGNNWGFEIIHLPSAWDISTGTQTAKIGVIDNGFYTSHSDYGDNVLLTSPQNQARNHGIAIAGIIGAQGDNGTGVAGVMWDCSLNLFYAGMASIKDKRIDSVLALVRMFQASRLGVNIINCSWGSYVKNMQDLNDRNAFYEQFIKRHPEILLVFAAGNNAADANYNSPSSLAKKYNNVISVGSVDRQGNLSMGPSWLIPLKLAWGSNFGDAVTVAAPGGDGNILLGTEDIFTFNDSGYGFFEGTSVAAPFVTGVAGLIWSINPGLSASDIKNIITEGSILGGRSISGQPFYIINAHESLRLAAGTLINPTAAIHPGSGSEGTRFIIDWTRFSSSKTLTSHLRKPGGTEFPNLTFGTDNQGNAAHTVDSTGFIPGTYEHWAVDDFTGKASNIVAFTIISIAPNNPPSRPSAPSGLGSSILGTSCSFSTFAADPDGDALEYRFDWGDGNISAWGFSTQTYVWSSVGTYVIKAQARDNQGAISLWSLEKTLDILPFSVGPIWPMYGYNPQHTGNSPFKGPLTASLLWYRSVGASIDHLHSSPVIDSSGTVFVTAAIYDSASPDHFSAYLVARDHSGTLKWLLKMGNHVRSTPAIGEDGTIYVSSIDYDPSAFTGYSTKLYAIDPSGYIKWYQLIGPTYNVANGGFKSSPVVFNNLIYIASDDTYLYAINSDGTIKWKLSAYVSGESTPAVDSGGVIYAMRGSNTGIIAIYPNGTTKFRRDFQSFGTSMPCSSPTIGNAGEIYLGVPALDITRSDVIAIDLNGNLLWRTTLNGSLTASPAIANDGSVYLMSFQRIMGGDYASTLYSFSPSGTINWTLDTGYSYITRSPVTLDSDGTIYISPYQKVIAVNPDGTTKWQLTITDVVGQPIIGNTGIIYVNAVNFCLCAIGE